MKEREKVLRKRLMEWGSLFRRVFGEGWPEEMPKEETPRRTFQVIMFTCVGTLRQKGISKFEELKDYHWD